MRAVEMQDQGDWIAQRVKGWGRVESVAGSGFEAYARLLHPVPFDKASEDAPGEVDRSWQTRRWAITAERVGKVMHPLVQWGRLRGSPDPYAGGSSVGWLDPEVLAAMVPLLKKTTSTPGNVIAGFWNGWGNSHIAGPSSLTIPPQREFVLMQTTLDELADPDWGRTPDIGWVDSERFPSVQLVWPEDHGWVIASEIDWDSTIIGGQRPLIDELINDSRFETYEVTAEDDLSWTGDTVNKLSGEPTTPDNPAEY